MKKIFLIYLALLSTQLMHSMDEQSILSQPVICAGLEGMGTLEPAWVPLSVLNHNGTYKGWNEARLNELNIPTQIEQSVVCFDVVQMMYQYETCLNASKKTKCTDPVETFLARAALLGIMVKAFQGFSPSLVSIIVKIAPPAQALFAKPLLQNKYINAVCLASTFGGIGAFYLYRIMTKWSRKRKTIN